jgi:hypothetical protein
MKWFLFLGLGFGEVCLSIPENFKQFLKEFSLTVKVSKYYFNCLPFISWSLEKNGEPLNVS